MNKDDAAGLVEELRALHVWPQFVADSHADILLPRQSKGLYGVGETAHRAAVALTTLSARVETLEAQGDSPFGALRSLIQSDPDYAWGWLCNLAVPIMDATGVSHELANQAASLIMTQMFGHDITAHPNFEYAKTGQQEYFEARIAAERNDGGDTNHG